MNSLANKARWIISSTLFGAILLFGVYGIVLSATESDPNRFVRDSTYVDECGACHLAYPPGLLPVESWQGIMAGLADHFGESAELDEETATYIGSYLERHALAKGQQSRIGKLMRNMPDDPPLRITELPAFIAAHDEIPKQLELEKLPTGYLSPCADCHRTAASSIFDKELLHPGYGPKVWGGPK
ncbi:MAG: hypothetical protein ABGY96_17320 [bacterium]|nr:hypothetical protein [Pseudomonadales bacterium]